MAFEEKINENGKILFWQPETKYRTNSSLILGMDLDASNQLLDELWAHIDNPEFTFTQVWQLHDLILWDNRCTLHRRDSFDPQSRRLMHRTQIKGSSVIPFE
jgi:taurine dioxygenase